MQKKGDIPLTREANRKRSTVWGGRPHGCRCGIAVACATLAGVGETTRAASVRGPTVYVLTRESTYQFGCLPPCRCPIFLGAGLEGTFQLTPATGDPLFEHYTVTNVHWTVRVGDTIQTITGSGRYRIGGEFALMHQLELDLTVTGQPPQHFDSGLLPGGEAFPAVDIVISLNGLTGCYDEWFDVQARPQAALPPHVRYRLLEGSWLIDDCPICDRPIIEWPLTGHFDLFLRKRSLQTDFYDVVDIHLQTADEQFVVQGSGVFRIGIGPAATQVMDLTVEINGEPDISLHGEVAAPGVKFPTLDVPLDEVTDSLTRIYRLRLLAHPVPVAAVPAVGKFTLACGAVLFAATGMILRKGRRRTPCPVE